MPQNTDFSCDTYTVQKWV